MLDGPILELFLLVLMVGLGGIFAAIAWTLVLESHQKNKIWTIPIGLYAITANVLAGISFYFVGWLIPSRVLDRLIDSDTSITVGALVVLIFQVIGYVSLCVGMALIGRNDGPGKRIVQVGNLVLFLTCSYALYAVLSVQGMVPSAVEHWIYENFQ